MMKKMHKIAVLAIVFCMVIASMGISVFAAEEFSGYSHRLKVSGGNGKVGSGTVEGKTASIDTAAGKVTVDGTEYDITVPGGDTKYVILGLKVAGHDNSEIYTDSVTFNVSGTGDGDSPIKKQDLDLVVAYGLKSNLVKYTVSYKGPGGEDLLPAETHYTVDKTRAVVSYKYVNGYVPNMISAVKTITQGGDNSIVFTYQVNTAGEGGTNVVVIDDGGGAAGAGGAGGAGAGAGGAGGVNIADGAAPAAGPADMVDLDDNQTPLAGDTNGDGVVDEKDIDDSKTPGASPWKTVGIGAGAIAVVAAAAAVIARRRRDYEEEDEEEEI